MRGLELGCDQQSRLVDMILKGKEHTVTDMVH